MKKARVERAFFCCTRALDVVLVRSILYPHTRSSYQYNIMSISIKTPQEIEKMRIAGRLAGEVLDYITPFVQAGVTTDELDKLCHDYTVNVQGGIPAPLNYAPGGHTPYPKSICTSINHQVCHGMPSDKKLKNGDIVNIDVTTIKDGYHGDTSRMYLRRRALHPGQAPVRSNL